MVRRKAAGLAVAGGVVSARSSALNAACSRVPGRLKWSVSAIWAAVVVAAPAYNMASAVEILVCEKTRLPGFRDRSARWRSIEKARLSFAKVVASSLLTTGEVMRCLLERSSFTGTLLRGGVSGLPSEPPQADSAMPDDTSNEWSRRRMATSLTNEEAS